MENKEIICAHVFFSGRVQGVFFRRTAAMKANIAGIKGWIRNLTDGRVEAVFEGEKEDIEKIIKNIGRGNPFIRVDNRDIVWEEYKGKFDSFDIRHSV